MVSSGSNRFINFFRSYRGIKQEKKIVKKNGVYMMQKKKNNAIKALNKRKEGNIYQVNLIPCIENAQNHEWAFWSLSFEPLRACTKTAATQIQPDNDLKLSIY